MLPRETSVRQLKMLRDITKGKDIGDLTSKDRLNMEVPNLQYVGNPVDKKDGVESWEEFSKHDSQLQTIAFKSKLVNKPLIKKDKNTMNECENVLKFKDFEKNWKPEESKKTKRTEVAKDILKEDYVSTHQAISPNIKPEGYKIGDIYYYLNDSRFKTQEKIYYVIKDIKNGNVHSVSIDNKYQDNPSTLELNDDIKSDKARIKPKNDIETFESFKLKDVSPKEEKQPEYTMLGEEKEPKSNPNFGYAAVRDREIKKIAFFNNFTIDPSTPKERQILNAGQLIDNGKVRGYVNRIEGSKVFVESLDEPMKIVEISLKDAVKPPVEREETIKKFNEISEELNKEFLKDK